MQSELVCLINTAALAELLCFLWLTSSLAWFLPQSRMKWLSNISVDVTPAIFCSWWIPVKHAKVTGVSIIATIFVY
jgi:hypothetical protein